MGRMKTVKMGLLAAALVLLGVLVFAAGLLDRQQVFTLAKLEQFAQGRTPCAPQGDGCSVMAIASTSLNLPAGDYVVHWQISGEGERTLRFGSSNGGTITPQRVTLPEGETAGEILLHLAELQEDFWVDMEYVSGNAVAVNALTLNTPRYKDDAVTLLLILGIAAALLVGYGCGRLHRAQAGMLVLIGLAVTLASCVCFKETLYQGHDTVFHLARIENLADGLRSGQFPVRMGGYSYNGFGAITSVFYADVFLTPFAVLRNGGASPTYVLNLYVAVMNGLSALTMYLCAKRIFGDRWVGACAAILYVLASYRATNNYIRCAVGEMTAMVMIPLFLLGLWEMVYGDKRRYAVLALGAAGVYLSHMLSTLICGVAALLFCLAHVVRIVREKRLLPLAKGALLTVLLCAFQLVPFLGYSLQGIGPDGMTNDVSLRTLEPASLLLLGTGVALPPRDRFLERFSLEIGFAMLLFAALAVANVLRTPKRGLAERAALISVTGGTLFAFACTTLFPWSYVAVLTGGLVDYLQLPWRLMTMVTPLFALAGGYGAVRAAHSRPDAAAVSALCAAALCVLPALNLETRQQEYIPFGGSGETAIQYIEYTLPGTKLEWVLDQSVYVDGDAALTHYQKTGTRVSAQVNADSDAVISLPLFGFDGFAAEVDGQHLAVGLGEMNRLTVRLPAGTQGTLRVWFAGKGVWRIFDGISLLTLLWLCVRHCLQKRTHRT